MAASLLANVTITSVKRGDRVHFHATGRSRPDVEHCLATFQENLLEDPQAMDIIEACLEDLFTRYAKHRGITVGFGSAPVPMGPGGDA